MFVLAEQFVDFYHDCSRTSAGPSLAHDAIPAARRDHSRSIWPAAQAAELARYELIGGGWRNSFEFLARVKQVTPQDVQKSFPEIYEKYTLCGFRQTRIYQSANFSGAKRMSKILRFV
ncbi:MAG: hypothetical protein HC846_07565 [Blastocatellia bacterium]|nr:hypothetical protein [Blastocatellia bacterium]